MTHHLIWQRSLWIFLRQIACDLHSTTNESKNKPNKPLISTPGSGASLREVASAFKEGNHEMYHVDSYHAYASWLCN